MTVIVLLIDLFKKLHVIPLHRVRPAETPEGNHDALRFLQNGFGRIKIML